MIIRKAYGGVYDVMGYKYLRGQMLEIDFMGAKGAVEIILRQDKDYPEKFAASEAEYTARFANPFVADTRSFIDDVIQPYKIRMRICHSWTMFKDKQETRLQARRYSTVQEQHESISDHP